MNHNGETRETITKEQMQKIIDKASQIRYGTVTLIIQDGVLVQIDCTEKTRLR